MIYAQGEAARSSEQQMRLAALVSSFNSLRGTCEGQVCVCVASLNAPTVRVRV
jgi:hypothetical protein